MPKATYIASPALDAAVEASISLHIPLLVTGAPGVGKTQLASYVAEKMDADLFCFNTKSSSRAKDLFYRYDAIRHFRDAQTRQEEVNVMDYIRFTGLGKAIIEAKQKEKRTVVLIDEIDKAPRDFPNDILAEFEDLAFQIEEASPEELRSWAKQTNHNIQVDDQGFLRFDGDSIQRPIIILTSNSEKRLPDAFLRRCTYYHIPIPDRESLIEIVYANVELSTEYTEKMLHDAIDHFIEIRKTKGLRKPPATAELISWIHILAQHNIDINSDIEGEVKKIAMSYSLLAKNREDLDRLFIDLDRGI